MNRSTRNQAINTAKTVTVLLSSFCTGFVTGRAIDTIVPTTGVLDSTAKTIAKIGISSLAGFEVSKHVEKTLNELLETYVPDYQVEQNIHPENNYNHRY
jgi:hypothetical protein